MSLLKRIEQGQGKGQSTEDGNGVYLKAIALTNPLCLRISILISLSLICIL